MAEININVSTILAKAEKANEAATHAMSQQALKDCNVYCPKDQSGLINSSLTNSDLEKGHLVWKTPYARHLYYGIIMVDPETGKACFPIGDQLYSRKGVKKVKSNREFRFAGRGRKLWAQAAAAQHKEDWKAVYEAALKGAMQK